MVVTPTFAFYCAGDSVVWGGEARAHSANQVIAWRKLQEFLRENVGQATTTKVSSHTSKL